MTSLVDEADCDMTLTAIHQTFCYLHQCNDDMFYQRGSLASYASASTVIEDLSVRLSPSSIVSERTVRKTEDTRV